MEQKQVKIIGFKAEGHRVIKAVTLTPDLMSKRLIQITGDSGNGKSTLINMLKTATGGASAIDKKDTLEKGYVAEVQLRDGDTPLFLGAKVTSYKRGEKEGEPKFEVYLYAKDNNDKHYTPIIDGEKATAADYQKMLNTPLTFSMSEFFSENQTIHRGLIEKLFKPELDAMDIDTVVENIREAKTARDVARQLTQGSGAYMEQFKKEGLDEISLKLVREVVTSDIEARKTSLLTDKAKLEGNIEANHQLACNAIDKERTESLQKKKDTILATRELIRVDNETKLNHYNTAKANFDKLTSEKNIIDKAASDLIEKLTELAGEEYADEAVTIQAGILKISNSRMANLKLSDTEPVQQGFDHALSEQLQGENAAYKTESELAIEYPVAGVLDTSEIDKKLASIEVELTNAGVNNTLFNRFALWQDWIEKKGIYEKEIDTLRALYASINTGVNGLSIESVITDSGRVEVWMQYNGAYDKGFFHNDNGEMRHIFAYSSFQRSAIGVMLQAARLNLKKKALRLAIIDDVAFTQTGLDVLSRLCEDLDVQLITSKTADPKIEDLVDSEILLQNGEMFFAKKQ